MPMKVLYVTNSIGMGGDSVALINLLEHLTKNNITPLVTCPAVGTFSNKLKKMNIPLEKKIDNSKGIFCAYFTNFSQSHRKAFMHY